MAQLLWSLGYAEQQSQEALALAQQLEHPPSLAHAHAPNPKFSYKYFSKIIGVKTH